jgi:uncharacterized protein (DUF927 family)
MLKAKPPNSFSSINGTRIVPGLRLLGVGRTPDGAFVAPLRLRVLDRWATIGLQLGETINARQIEQALARFGFISPHRQKAARTLKEHLGDARNVRMISIADGNGWYDDFSAFVLGRKVLGEPRRPLVVLGAGSLPHTSGQLIVRRTAKGSWKKWQAGTHKALARSDFLLAAVCLGLAGTMAAPFGEIESGLIHFHGESSIGKTILLMVAWSLFGPCSREFLPNWNTTPSGFEDQLEVCTDLPFICDELTFQAEAREASHNLKTASYAISSNRKKGRSKYWGGGGSAIRRGKTFVLSTGEDSLDATRNTASRRLGEQCRAIDVAVSSRFGIFRRLPKDTTFDQLVRGLEACCRDNSGHAGRRFIRSLIKSKDKWPARAARRMRVFLQRAKVDDTRLDRRFAIRFALAYAAGMEAKRCGILRLPAKKIARALVRVYKASAQP